ncbi:type II toxin-antitoxin system HicA family toxin [Mariniphaga sediminis]|uniref:Type II toxin-antitoxin system HicA family toxin n=2 Tax=Mariniphaga sediminis TaxID=1628158 RepID=A0A399CVI4_9BACT|nr:type II toxin-antitoxin system HicA family toxin [Mariniphaga sediminis]
MTKKDKLISRFLGMPSDFHYDEMVKLLRYFSFHEVKTGKTSGSRVKFINEEGVMIMLHKPHPSGIMKRYQMKQIKEVLEL